MSLDILQKIVKEHPELASLPQVMVEIIRVSNDPDSSAADLAKVAMKDPGLAARLLRVVNTPHYGTTTEITTIQQAVVTMGMRTVTAIALSSSVYGLVNKLTTTIDRKRFWRHSLEVALAARMIATAINYEPAEEAFVAGLLHEIGLLILETSFVETYMDIWPEVESGVSLTEMEERHWATNHARVGQFLLDQWKVPALIGAAVGSHHNAFEEGEKSPELKLNQIVNLANQMSKFRAYDAPVPISGIVGNKKAMAANLELSNSSLAELEKDLISEVVAESSYLEIEIGSMEEILKEANYILFKQYLAVEKLLSDKQQMPFSGEQDKVSAEGDPRVRRSLVLFGRHIGSIARLMSENAAQLERLYKPQASNNGDRAGMLFRNIASGSDLIQDIISELGGVSGDYAIIDNEKHIAALNARVEARLEALKPADEAELVSSSIE